MMDTKILAKFAKVQAKFRALEEERDALRTLILESLVKDKVVKTESQYGTFTVSNRDNYSYSENVKKFAEALKEKKCEEERKGIATKTVTTFLTYTPAKM